MAVLLHAKTVPTDGLRSNATVTPSCLPIVDAAIQERTSRRADPNAWELFIGRPHFEGLRPRSRGRGPLIAQTSMCFMGQASDSASGFGTFLPPAG